MLWTFFYTKNSMLAILMLTVLFPSLPSSYLSILLQYWLACFPFSKDFFPFSLLWGFKKKFIVRPPPRVLPGKDSIKHSFYLTADSNASTRASLGLVWVCSLLSENPSKTTESSRKPQLLRLHMDHLRGQTGTDATIAIHKECEPGCPKPWACLTQTLKVILNKL